MCFFAGRSKYDPAAAEIKTKKLVSFTHDYRSTTARFGFIYGRVREGFTRPQGIIDKFRCSQAVGLTADFTRFRWIPTSASFDPETTGRATVAQTE